MPEASGMIEPSSWDGAELVEMDIVERLIVYRDRPGRSREGRDLLADACNEIHRLRKDNSIFNAALRRALERLDREPKA